MTEELERILSQLTQPDNAVIQQATAQPKQAFKDPAIIPALCAIMSGSEHLQIRQSAAVMLRMRVKFHWKKITLDDRESLKAAVLQAFMQKAEHTVQHSLSQLCAVMVKHETPDRWPALMQLLIESTKSSNPNDRQVGLLLLNKVMESNPEPFKPYYCQLLQLFNTVLMDHSNPMALYYCICSLTAITAYTGTEEMNQMRSIIPNLIVALKHLIKADQDQASEAMEVLHELMKSEVSIIVPHITDIVCFCLEVGTDTTLSDSLRVKALSCIDFLIRLKSKTVPKLKLLSPILQAIFPVLVAAPPPGEQDPEDEEEDDGESTGYDNPKHCAGQIIDAMALHMPPEKLLQPLMPLAHACLASENPYQRKGGIMCLALLAEGCADHIRTKMLSSFLQKVCQSLSDSDQIVRSASLFALGQFSEHLQPEVSKYCSELMPLLLGYLSSLSEAKVSHVTKAFHALKNFMENLGADIEPYLFTLMETMLSALNNNENLKIKELAVSAIGAIAIAAKELLVPYFPPVFESLKGFLTTTTEEMRSLQTQSLATLAVLARTIGKDAFSPLATECVQLGLNLTDAIDDPDLRRCTYGLFSAVATVSPECLTPHLPAITAVMLLALKSNEGITAHLEEDKTFVLLDDDDDDEDNEEEKDVDDYLEDETEADASDVKGFTVKNAYVDEKEDACDALGEIAFSTGAAFQPFLESSFQQVYEMRDYRHEAVRRAAFGAMCQFCQAQHQVWTENPTEANHQALLKLLDVVIPCFLQTVRKEQQHQVVMGILESMNNVIKTCKQEAFKNPARLKEISHVIRDVLLKKTVCQDAGADETDDEVQQAEYDAMLRELAGEGIPLLASSVPATDFAPFLNELLPLIIKKSKNSCTVAERSFAVGTIREVLQVLASMPGGRGVAGGLSSSLLSVLVAGVMDSDPEVRNNSVFGLGCLAEAAGPIIVSDYPMMLSVFSILLTEESNLRVIDNVCAALCRMIMSNVDAVPLEQATAQPKQAFKDPAIIPALCAIMNGSEHLQIRQSAAVMLRMRVKFHWKKITLDDRESLKAAVLQAFMQKAEHTFQHSLSQLCAVMVKHETPDRWPALMQLLNESTKSSNPNDRQVGLLLLNKVMESNPEPFKPYYCQLLQLFNTVLMDHSNPMALYYCICSLTAITAYTGTEEMNQMRSIIPNLIVALKHLIKADQDQASEAMEVLNELMESEVSIIVPHIADIVCFCLEVGTDTTLSDFLRVRALSCIDFLIRLKSKTVPKLKLLSPILQAIFPVLVAAPPPGEQDPEDEEEDDGESTDYDNPKHCAGQIIDAMALHMPPEKLLQPLMPLAHACLVSENPYQRKGGIMCLALLAEGCADHIRTKMLSSFLQKVCQSLSDSDQIVRSASLFALGQFSEHLQPEVSKYCSELMPLLLGYLSSLSEAKVSHVTKAFHALENLMENLGADIEPYLFTLMETMLSALNNNENLKIKELAVSAIGAIAIAAKELLVPYFPPVFESLKGFLTTTTEEMRSLQTQSLATLALLARTIGKDAFSPLATECVQLGLNLTDAIDDPDLRRCTYGLFSAVATVSPECLTPHLPAITAVMLLALKSNEGITAHLEEDKTFVLFDDDEDNEEEKDVDDYLEDETEADASDVKGFTVKNAYVDEKEDACDALGEIAFSTGAAFQPFLESSFQQVYEMRDYPHEDVRGAAFGAMCQFCQAQHRVWTVNPTEANHQALLKLLDVVIPCFLQTVRKEQERQVVMGILESMNYVIKTCKQEAFKNPARLKEISHVIRDVLLKKTVCQDAGADETDDEEQQAYDAMLRELAGKGIPLLASSVPATDFAPFLNELLPLIIKKSKNSCTVAERSFAVGTIREVLQALASMPGGRGVAGRLSSSLLSVLVAGVRDSDPEVRNNSVFGLGCLAEAAGPIIVSDYPMMLSVFSNLLTKESNLRVIDNVCAALCRMIMSNVDAVPLEQVLPAMVERLPLKEDMEENKTVFNCLAMLYTKSPSLVVKLMKPIVAISSNVLGDKNVDKETQKTLVMLIKQFGQHHSAEFQAAVTSLPGEQQAKLSAAISAL